MRKYRVDVMVDSYFSGSQSGGVFVWAEDGEDAIKKVYGMVGDMFDGSVEVDGVEEVEDEEIQGEVLS